MTNSIVAAGYRDDAEEEESRKSKHGAFIERRLRGGSGKTVSA